MPKRTISRSAFDRRLFGASFFYKMDAEYGVKLPEYNDEGLTAYLEKVKRLVAYYSSSFSARS